MVLQLHAASIRNAPPQLSEAASKGQVLAIARATFEQLNQTKPVLPSTESVLPALLALRKVHNVTAESQEFLETQRCDLDGSKKQLEAENASLADQHALTKALEKRIRMLRDELDRKQSMSTDALVQEHLDTIRKDKDRYTKEVRFLMRTLKKFVDEQLGAMLAAEDLGGPVVGDMMDVDADNLASGFSATGKPKKSKANVNEDKRQRRIDQMWPIEEGTPEKALMKDRDEASAAGAEIKQLVEELLNKSFEADGFASDAYVKISRESSAVRFLIRSKVAQFHPKDATGLRLVDFGGELYT